jgi:hypothetical protein
MEPFFTRLVTPVRPAVVWVRDGGFRYRKCEGHGIVLEAGQLCQIGVHLAIEGENPRTLFCQIVSGPHRGLRFEYRSDFFETKTVAA